MKDISQITVLVIYFYVLGTDCSLLNTLSLQCLLLHTIWPGAYFMVVLSDLSIVTHGGVCAWPFLFTLDTVLLWTTECLESWVQYIFMKYIVRLVKFTKACVICCHGYRHNFLFTCEELFVKSITFVTILGHLFNFLQNDIKFYNCCFLSFRVTHSSEFHMLW